MSFSIIHIRIQSLKRSQPVNIGTQSTQNNAHSPLLMLLTQGCSYLKDRHKANLSVHGHARNVVQLIILMLNFVKIAENINKTYIHNFDNKGQQIAPYY